MAETNWTPEQRAAISLKPPLLISAGAGSGKTAVLVERILQKILDDQQPIDINRLLVVTFTKAAAAEMRDRIRRRLENELYNEVDSSKIQRLLNQISLLPRAHITTLHAFCLELLRKYYYLIDYDPGFRVIDDIEAALIRQDCIEELFEENYQAENPEFLALVEAFGSDRDDQMLMEHILNLYDFACSQPSPQEWLDSLKQGYQWNCVSDFLASKWGKAVICGIEDAIDIAINHWEMALQYCSDANGPTEYAEMLEEELEILRQIKTALEHSDWNMLEGLMNSISFKSLPRKKKEADGDPITHEIKTFLRESAKSHRDQGKSIITKLQKEVFGWSLTEQLPKLREMGTLVEAVARLVTDFAKKYARRKRERKVIDYADMEHLTIHLLTALDVSPQILAGLRHQFAEILVDEFQDINPAQARLLSLFSCDGKQGNLFRVGDVKQSIYRFRMADPSLFIGLYHSCPRWNPSIEKEQPENSQGLVIDLRRNFRSRPEIIDGVNFIFMQVMTKEAGEFPYDHNAALQYGASYLIQEHPIRTAHGPVEFHLVDLDAMLSETEPKPETETEDPFPELDLNQVRLEARFVAQRIHQMVNNAEFYILDKATKQYRPVNYSDIVILMRSYSNNAPVFIEELQKLNIPVYGETNSGYFAASEVETMISLLQIIDNPHNDIPLVAVLRSPIVGLNGDELGRIRTLLPEGDFYEALALAITVSLEDHPQSHEIRREVQSVLEPYRQRWDQLIRQAHETFTNFPDVKAKLAYFAKRFYSWRSLAPFLKISDLIWQIYQDTGYLTTVGCLPGGKQRQANLRLLYDRACRFEKTHNRGLFRFLRYLERHRQQNIDIGSAPVLGTDENIVRIMSVHASKGLEFPVVIVAGLGNKFNFQNLRSHMLMHKELGVGIPVFDLEHRVRYPSIIQYAVKNQLLREMLAEEMRILYVAMTRAKERLILFGSTTKLNSKVTQWHSLTTSDGVLPHSVLRSATSYLDWLGPAIARHANDVFQQREGFREFNRRDRIDDPSHWQVTIHRVLSRDHEDGGQTVPAVEDHPENLALLEQIRSQLHWKYPHPVNYQYRAKISVSELKNKYAIQNLNATFEAQAQLDPGVFRLDADIIRKPAFLQANRSELSTTEKGIALHTACQHLPLENWQDWPQWTWDEKYCRVEDYLQKLVDSELLTPAERESITPKILINLLDGTVGHQLLNAARVLREVPFTFLMRDKDGTEGSLIQGVIDVLLINRSQQAAIIDYKSDVVPRESNPSDFFLRKYGIQLKLYKLAVEQLTKYPVVSCSIYSFDLGKEIELIHSLHHVNIGNLLAP